jgi:hypothetical protein
VDQERLSSLAHDVLGLEQEYRDRHGYPPAQARAATLGEVLEGERAREDLRPNGCARPARPSGRSAGAGRSAARTATTAEPRTSKAPAVWPGPCCVSPSMTGRPSPTHHWNERIVTKIRRVLAR